LFSLLYLNYWWQQRLLKRQERQLQAKEQVSEDLNAAIEEKDLLRKQYGMLEQGLEEVKKHLRSKTIDLARKAKENDEKNRLLQRLKEKMEELLQQPKTTKFQWKKLSRILDTYQVQEDHSFSLQIEELHRDFLRKLSQRFPDLTTYDLRLCAYLKSGMTTREIAKLMNVLPSSVNVSRSRLRKKLGLAAKDDLFKYLKAME